MHCLSLEIVAIMLFDISLSDDDVKLTWAISSNVEFAVTAALISTECWLEFTNIKKLYLCAYMSFLNFTRILIPEVSKRLLFNLCSNLLILSVFSCTVVVISLKIYR